MSMNVGQNNNLGFSGKFNLVIPPEQKEAVERLLKEEATCVSLKNFTLEKLAAAESLTLSKLPPSDSVTVTLKERFFKIDVPVSRFKAFLNKRTGKKPEQKDCRLLYSDIKYEPGAESRKLGMVPIEKEDHAYVAFRIVARKAEQFAGKMQRRLKGTPNTTENPIENFVKNA